MEATALLLPPVVAAGAILLGMAAGFAWQRRSRPAPDADFDRPLLGTETYDSTSRSAEVLTDTCLYWGGAHAGGLGSKTVCNPTHCTLLRPPPVWRADFAHHLCQHYSPAAMVLHSDVDGRGAHCCLVWLQSALLFLLCAAVRLRLSVPPASQMVVIVLVAPLLHRLLSLFTLPSSSGVYLPRRLRLGVAGLGLGLWLIAYYQAYLGRAAPTDQHGLPGELLWLWLAGTTSWLACSFVSELGCMLWFTSVKVVVLGWTVCVLGEWRRQLLLTVLHPHTTAGLHADQLIAAIRLWRDVNLADPSIPEERFAFEILLRRRFLRGPCCHVIIYDMPMALVKPLQAEGPVLFALDDTVSPCATRGAALTNGAVISTAAPDRRRAGGVGFAEHAEDDAPSPWLDRDGRAEEDGGAQIDVIDRRTAQKKRGVTHQQLAEGEEGGRDKTKTLGRGRTLGRSKTKTRRMWMTDGMNATSRAALHLTHSREALVSARQAVLSAVHRLIAVTRFMPAADRRPLAPQTSRVAPSTTTRRSSTVSVPTQRTSKSLRWGATDKDDEEEDEEDARGQGKQLGGETGGGGEEVEQGGEQDEEGSGEEDEEEDEEDRNESGTSQQQQLSVTSMMEGEGGRTEEGSTWCDEDADDKTTTATLTNLMASASGSGGQRQGGGDSTMLSSSTGSSLDLSQDGSLTEALHGEDGERYSSSATWADESGTDSMILQRSSGGVTQDTFAGMEAMAAAPPPHPPARQQADGEDERWQQQEVEVPLVAVTVRSRPVLDESDGGGRKARRPSVLAGAGARIAAGAT